MSKLLKFKKIQGLESLLFGLLILFLPVNLAKHFIFNFCYVDGILVDYLIPTVYLTDILIWGLLGFWVFREARGFKGFGRLFVGERFVFLFFCFFVLVSGLSVFQATKRPAAVYKWLKLVEHVLFSFYVSKHTNLKKDWPTIVKLLSIGVLFESVLAIAQWFKQSSIFGYWFFGENKFTVSTPGIATFDFFGTKKVRPYGTLPHPNVLGGYLAVVLPWVFYVLVRKMQNAKRFVTNYWLLVTSCGAAALLLSFSRSAWAIGVLGLLGVFWLVLRRKSSLFSPFYSLMPSAYSLSFLRRAELNWIALEITKDNPLLGVGLNNFTVRMGEYGQVSGWVHFLQPVHNVYLLIAAETGLIGLAAFLFLLLFAINYLRLTINDPLRRLLLISLSQISLLCFVDHYFLTLQQTSLLFWLLVGLVFLEYNQKGR